MRVCERVCVLFFAMAKFKVHASVVIIVVVVNVAVVVVALVDADVAFLVFFVCPKSSCNANLFNLLFTNGSGVRQKLSFNLK